jgi:hypothetical protein
MDWLLWSAELATAVTVLHFHSYMKNIVYGHRANRRREQHRRIFSDARRMDGPDALRKVQVILQISLAP